MTLIKDLLQLNEAASKKDADEILKNVADSNGISIKAAKAIFVSGDVSKAALAKLEKDGYDSAGGWTENKEWFKKHGISKADHNILCKLSESVQLDEGKYDNALQKFHNACVQRFRFDLKLVDSIQKSDLVMIFHGEDQMPKQKKIAKVLTKDGWNPEGDWAENKEFFGKLGLPKKVFNDLFLSESVQLDEAYFEDDNIEVTDEVNDFCDQNEIKITKDGKYGLVKFKGAINKLKKLIQQFTKDPEDYYGAIVESASITEGKQYADGSADFESDASDVSKHLKDALKILKKAEWKDWMNSSDENFSSKSGNALAKSEKVVEKLKDVIKDFDALYDHLASLE